MVFLRRAKETGLGYAGQLWQSATLVLRSRLVILLVAFLVLMNVGVVITRTVSTAQMLPMAGLRYPLVLLEELTVENLIRHKVTIGLSESARMGEGADSVLFGDKGGRRALTFTTTSLDSMYILIVPILALLFGCNLLPHDQRIYGSIFSLPIRRSGFYARHLLVLLISILSFFSMLLVIDLALMSMLLGAQSLSYAKILHFNIYGAIWALFFGCLGLLLGNFRRRATALIVGLICTVLFVGVLPAVQYSATMSYMRSLSPEAFQALQSGVTLKPPFLMRLLALANYLPGSAQVQALDALSTRDFEPDESASNCSSCPTSVSLASLLAHSYLSLLGSAGIAVIIGMIAFAKKGAAT